MLRVLFPMIHPRRHDRGWPRFTLAQSTAVSDQSHRLYVSVQGRIDSHDARGPHWEVVQHRPLNSAGERTVPTIEPHELFEAVNLSEAVEDLDLPEATRDFIRDELDNIAQLEAALQQADAPCPDDPLWTYWDYIPDQHRAALNAAAEAKDGQ
jgi:hypothetical protein